MNYQDVKTSDDRDMWLWEREREAVTMATIARDIWKDPEVERAWWQEAEDCRRARLPKDQLYQPHYLGAHG